MTPPIELRRTGVDRDRTALRDVADLLHLVIDQHPQHGAAVIRRAANEKIAGDLAPAFLQPSDIGLEAAGCSDRRRGANRRYSRQLLHHRRQEHAVLDVECGDLGCTLDRLTPDEVDRMADFLTRASALISKRKAKLMIVCGQSALAQAAKEEIR